MRWKQIKTQHCGRQCPNTLVCQDILIDTDDDERPARIAYTGCSAGGTMGCP
jgi:hypothetical protein